MCCIGCQAVASAIVDGGLEQFYRYRSSNSESKTEADGFENDENFEAYDLPEVQRDLLTVNEQGIATIDLTISGISCAACAWLIEHHLDKLPGMVGISVNVSRQRCRVQWQQDELALSRILAAFVDIGFRARPARESDNLQDIEKEQRVYLLRLGVAGIGMMQAGMLAVALYAGAFQGMDGHWQNLLRWVSLIVATPVVLYSAQPFFTGAKRSLRSKRLTMDVPIALALALAYGASAWATLSQSGEVYFDAVSMLTFFLLLGRFLEMRVRYRNELVAGEAAQLIPLTALRYHDDELGGVNLKPVLVKSLEIGDVIQIAEGECLAVDGVIIEGESSVIEAVLTGEQRPLGKVPGDSVSAGTINTTNRLKVKVTAVGQETRFAAIVNMLDGVAAEKPQQVVLADQLAGWFVAFVLLVAAAVFTGWWLYAPDRALWVTLSVLVVTCPCALSLATPVALTAATGLLQRRGFLVRSAQALQTLPRVSTVVLDKTGTLTTGKLEIDQVILSEEQGGFNTDSVLEIAASLEQGCRHPIALALGCAQTNLPVEDLNYHVGGGLRGLIDGELYALGNLAFIAEVFTRQTPASTAEDLTASGLALAEAGARPKVEVVLANRQGLIAHIILADALRPGAQALITELKAQGLGPELLSGDQAKSAGALANYLGITTWYGDNTPEDKLAYIHRRQAEGEVVLMVGDGINDVPVLSAADISVAMAEATDFTRMASDAVLLSANLNTLLEAITVARRTSRVIRQNIAWALFYNVSALPLAALGWIPPWAAAIGMSLSSLVVVLNALRLQRTSPTQEAKENNFQQEQHVVSALQSGA